MTEGKLYLYPVWLRIWHGLNALCILVLIFTGLSLQYSSNDSIFLDFNIAVTFHNIFGVILALSYLVFVIGNLITSNGIFYKLEYKGLLNRVIKQLKFYLLGYFKNESAPFPVSKTSKFNPLQKLTYVSTMYVFLPLLIITGIGLLFPSNIIDSVFEFNGIKLTTVIHYTIGFFVSLFLIIHLYFASVGKNPLDNFKSIINGYH